MDWRVLARLGVLLPQAWDAIIPHGPVVSVGHRHFHGRGEEVFLNPQPLPPEPPPELFVGASMFNALATHGIIIVSGRGEQFLADIDDWCGTGWPRRWPRPPKAEQWDQQVLFAGAAAAAATLAGQYGHDQEIQDVLAKAAEQLSEQAAR